MEDEIEQPEGRKPGRASGDADDRMKSGHDGSTNSEPSKVWPREYRARCCPYAHNNGAHALLDTGLFRLMDEDEQEASEDDAEHRGPAWEAFHAGMNAYHCTDIEAALEHLTRAVSLAPKAWPIRCNLAIAMVQSRQTEEGITQLRIAERGAEGHPGVAYNLALALWCGGRLGEAKEVLSAALENHPEVPSLWYLLARVRGASDDRTGALDAMRRAADLAEDPAIGAHDLGAALASAGQLREAVAEFSRAIELAPEEPLPHYNLARVYVQLGEDEKAAACFRRHLELEPEHSCARLELAQTLIRIDTAERDAEGEPREHQGGADSKPSSQSAGPLASAQAAPAKTAEGTGASAPTAEGPNAVGPSAGPGASELAAPDQPATRPTARESEINSAIASYIEMEPADPAGHTALATVRMLKHDLEPALAEARLAEATDHCRPWDLFLQAEILFRLGRFNESLAQVERALAGDEDERYTRLYLRVLGRLGRFLDGLDVLGADTTIDPEEGLFHLIMQLREGEHHEALRWTAQVAADRFPLHTWAIDAHARALFLCKAYDEAALLFYRSLQLSSADPSDYTACAYTMLCAGRFRTALEVSEACLAKFASNARALELRFYALDELGRASEAELAARELLKIDAEHPDAIAFLNRPSARRALPSQVWTATGWQESEITTIMAGAAVGNARQTALRKQARLKILLLAILVGLVSLSVGAFLVRLLSQISR